MVRMIIAAAFLLSGLAAAHADSWFQIDPQNTLVIDTTKGRIVIEMRPDFAPQSVARVKLLSREGVYDGLLFHRVIEGFVDQTGNPNNHDGGVSVHPNLPPEFFTTLQDQQIDTVASRASDSLAGFVGALPFVAVKTPGRPGWRAWGAYCAGVAGMGRQAEIGTGNSEIFFMRDASRRLDHDYAAWGRVVSGLEVVQAISVGEPPPRPDRMIKVRVAADLPVAEQPRLDVIDTRSDDFRNTVQALRKKEGADFSICDVPIATRSRP